MHRAGARGPLLAITAAMAVILGSTACGDGQDQSPADLDPGDGEPVSGGTLVIGVESESPGLDPARDSIQMSGRIISAALFDTLMAVGEDGAFVPFAAESLEHDDSLTTWTVNLRDGITFHDGTPLDAAAVKANLDRQFETRVTFQNVDRIDVVDDLTVQITTKIPWGAFPDVLASQLGYLGSPTAIDEMGEEEFGQAPIGSGPYVFKEWVRDSQLTLTRNPDYWRDDVAFVEEIEFRPIPDEDARIAALRAGDIDIALLSGGALSQIQAAGEFDVRTIPTGVIGLALNMEKPHLGDVRVRRALGHALNRQALMDVAWKGENDPWSSPLTPDSPYAVDVPFPEHDVEQAKALLSEYEADTGETVQVRIDWAASAQNLELVQLIQAQWQEAGVEVEIGSPMDLATFNQHMFEHSHQVAPFELFQNIDPDLWLFAWWQSDSFLNLPRFHSERVDELLVEGRSSVDPEVRAAAYREIQEINADQLPWLFLTPAHSGAAYGSHVRGVGSWTVPGATPSVGQEARVTVMPDSVWIAR